MAASYQHFATFEIFRQPNNSRGANREVFKLWHIPSEISLSWTSDIDGSFSTQGSDSNGNIAFGYNNLSAGLHNITITATDSDGLTTSVLQTLRINTPPSAPIVSILPNAANTNDNLSVALAETPDADGDSINYTYAWLKN